MNVNYDKIDAVRGELTVAIEEKDYAEKVKKQLKEIGRRRPEAGFRPGMTPEGILKKKYGLSVKYDVINNLVGTAVYDYIRENNIKVLGQPVPIAEGASDLEDRDQIFRFKVGVAPELDVKVDKKVKVPYYKIKITDEMVSDRDNALRRRFGTQGPGEVTEPTALVKGVITELNEDGSVKEGGVVVENGILALQYFKSDEQKKLFEDKHPGDVVKFNPAATCDANPVEMSSMLNIDKADVENYKGDFNIEIKEIIVVKPAELDQDYFDMVFGKDKVHNETEYRDAVKAMIAAELLTNSDYRFSIDVRNTLLGKLGTVELPDDILKDYLKTNEKGSITQENVDAEYEKMKPTLIWQLLQEELVKQLDVKLSEEDLKKVASAMVRDQLAQYGMFNAPEQLVEKYVGETLANEQSRRQIADQALNGNLFAALKEAVTLNEKEVSVADFEKLFN